MFSSLLPKQQDKLGTLLTFEALYRAWKFVCSMSGSRHLLKAAPEGDKNCFGDGKKAAEVPGDDSFFVNKQGMRLATRYWEPDESNGVLAVVVHGFGEHAERYSELARCLIAEGTTVAALDHQGHGRSEGDRTFVEKFQDYVDDLLYFVEEICLKRKFPFFASKNNKKVFLVGHSMGGLIATTAVLRRQDLFAALVLSGPALDVKPENKSFANVLAAKVLSRWLPKLPVAHLPIAGISRDRQIMHRFLNDPLVYRGGMRARWVEQCLATQAFVWERVARLTIPLLIFHGDHDILVPLAASQRLMDEATNCPDKTLHAFPGGYHEILSEQPQFCIHKTLIPWLELRLLQVN